MNRSQIIALQKAVGTEPDGFFGPASIKAVQKHLRKLMPAVSPWPKSDYTSMRRFYGEPGDESALVSISLGGTWMVGDKAVTKTRCHAKVAASLTRIFAELARLGYNKTLPYDGCYNDRNMRGGTSKSIHAWGAAVDLDAGNNGNLTAWPVKATMPLEVMEVFAREGWLSAGAFWLRDSMHFQCTH